jgi:hypothetical protein
MLKKAKWVGIAVLAVLFLVLARWAIRGESFGAPSKLPTQVFGGGAVALEIEVESSVDSLVSIVFIDSKGQRRENASERVTKGKHARTIMLPAGVGGHVEVLGIAPGANDQMTLRLRGNREVLYAGTSTLHRNLWSGFAQPVLCEDMPVGAKPPTPACWSIHVKIEDFSQRPRNPRGLP